MNQDKRSKYSEKARRKYNAHKGNPKKKRKKQKRRIKPFKIPFV